MKADLRPGAAIRGVAAGTGGVASAGDRGATAAVCFDCDRRAATPADWAALPSAVLSPVSPSLQRQPADSLAAVQLRHSRLNSWQRCTTATQGCSYPRTLLSSPACSGFSSHCTATLQHCTTAKQTMNGWTAVLQVSHLGGGLCSTAAGHSTAVCPLPPRPVTRCSSRPHCRVTALCSTAPTSPQPRPLTSSRVAEIINI